MTNKNIVLNLANKYRPNKFSDVVGQDHVIKVIEQQVKNNTLPPSIILYGFPGIGKTTISRIIAKSLNSSPYGLIEKDSSLDGGKENMLELHSDIYNKPFSGNTKIYLFDEAHNITSKAFESLLTIIEEPPENVRFIFCTTEFDKLPLTIKSRSQCHHLSKLKNNVIKEQINKIIKLEKLDVPDELINLIVESSDGSLRNSIFSLETVVAAIDIENLNVNDILGILGSNRISNFLLSYINKDFKGLISSVGMFYSEGINTQKAIYDFQQFIVDMRLCLILPKMVQDVHSNVSIIFGKIFKEGLNSNEIVSTRKNISKMLDTAYKYSLELESNNRRTLNKEAMFTDFVINLAKSWS